MDAPRPTAGTDAGAQTSVSHNFSDRRSRGIGGLPDGGNRGGSQHAEGHAYYSRLRGHGDRDLGSLDRSMNADTKSGSRRLTPADWPQWWQRRLSRAFLADSHTLTVSLAPHRNPLSGKTSSAAASPAHQRTSPGLRSRRSPRGQADQSSVRRQCGSIKSPAIPDIDLIEDLVYQRFTSVSYEPSSNLPVTLSARRTLFGAVDPCEPHFTLDGRRGEPPRHRRPIGRASDVPCLTGGVGQGL